MKIEKTDVIAFLEQAGYVDIDYDKGECKKFNNIGDNCIYAISPILYHANERWLLIKFDEDHGLHYVPKRVSKLLKRSSDKKKSKLTKDEKKVSKNEFKSLNKKFNKLIEYINDYQLRLNENQKTHAINKTVSATGTWKVAIGDGLLNWWDEVDEIKEKITGIVKRFGKHTK